MPALRAWLQLHPRRGDPEAPLFTSIAQGRHKQGHQLWPWGVYWMLKNCCRRAGIRTLNPHLFRHSRATRAAKAGWSEAMMRAYFGWAPGSDMPLQYIHLAHQDMEDQVRRDAGIDALGRLLRANETECRFCLEPIRVTAWKCKHCGEFQNLGDRNVFGTRDADAA